MLTCDQDVFEVGKRFLAYDRLKHGEQLTLHQNGLRFGVLKLVADFSLFISWIHRADNDTDRGGRNEGDGIFRAIRRKQAYAIAFLHTKLVKTIGDAVDHKDHFTIR